MGIKVLGYRSKVKCLAVLSYQIRSSGLQFQTPGSPLVLPVWVLFNPPLDTKNIHMADLQPSAVRIVHDNPGKELDACYIALSLPIRSCPKRPPSPQSPGLGPLLDTPRFEYTYVWLSV